MDLNKNIQSRYYGREFAVNTVITEDGKELIRHASLVNIIFNELDPAPLVTYDLKSGDPTHPMVYCTIADEKRRITAFGESTPLARNGNPIAEAHPGAMAHNAAFDLAAKIFLGIPNDFYTDEEIPVYKVKERMASEPYPEEEIPVVPVRETAKEEKASVKAEPQAVDAEPAVEPAPVEKPKAEAPKAEEPADAAVKTERKPKPAKKKAEVKEQKTEEPKPENAEAVVITPEPDGEAVEVAVSNDEPLSFMPEPENEAEQPAEPVPSEPVPAEVVPEAAPADTAVNEEAAKYGAIQLNIGLYNGKPHNTIAEVVEKDPTFIRNIMKIDKPVAVVAEKIEMVRKYLAASGKEI